MMGPLRSFVIALAIVPLLLSASASTPQRGEKNDFPHGAPPAPPDDSVKQAADAKAQAPAKPVTPPDPILQTPQVPIPRAAPSPAPQPPRTVEQLLEGVAALDKGAARDQVFAKLGSPAYKMVLNEDGHAVERYRFRAQGGVDLVAIELRDGIVTSIRRLR